MENYVREQSVELSLLDKTSYRTIGGSTEPYNRLSNHVS